METAEFIPKPTNQHICDGNLTELQLELNKLYERVIIQKFHKVSIKNNYPTKQEMEQIVERHNTTFKKVCNWFKQKRRRQFLKGKLEKENYKKNWFSNDQNAYLKKLFANNMHPTNQEYIELAKLMNTSQKHIKNWFSHQRQKLSKIPSESNIPEKSTQNSQIAQQNYIFLQQIMQNLPLAQRLQLALGNASNENIFQHLASPYYLNQQYIQFLQTQQYLNCMTNLIKNFQKKEENLTTGVPQQFQLQQPIPIPQQPPKQSFKLVAKNEY